VGTVNQKPLNPIRNTQNGRDKMKEFKFTSKNGTETSKISKPAKNCLASRVLLDVLAMGKLPEGQKLTFARSYNAHYIAQRGKNALGFFDTHNVLVVNGIAEDLKKAGVKGISRPSKSKAFKAIKLDPAMKDKDVKILVGRIARVLGITGGPKPKAKTSPKKKTPPAKTSSTPDTPEAEGATA